MLKINRPTSADFLAGGGEMGALMRAYDWSRSPLGKPETWPQSLRTAVRILLNTNHPMFIWWGPDLVQFYNDAYRQTMGPERHPGALGQGGRECWAEIWHVIGPQIEQVMSGGGATWHENQLVPVTRHGKQQGLEVIECANFQSIPGQGLRAHNNGAECFLGRRDWLAQGQRRHCDAIAAVSATEAGFSEIWLKQILRQRLSFDGIIFSDDLSMEGASSAGGIVERTRAAFDAGCDLVLVCNSPQSADELLATLDYQMPATALARAPAT